MPFRRASADPSGWLGCAQVTRCCNQSRIGSDRDNETVWSRLSLKACDWTTRIGRRNPGSEPRGSARSGHPDLAALHHHSSRERLTFCIWPRIGFTQGRHGIRKAGVCLQEHAPRAPRHDASKGGV